MLAIDKKYNHSLGFLFCRLYAEFVGYLSAWDSFGGSGVRLERWEGMYFLCICNTFSSTGRFICGVYTSQDHMVSHYPDRVVCIFISICYFYFISKNNPLEHNKNRNLHYCSIEGGWRIKTPFSAKIVMYLFVQHNS